MASQLCLVLGGVRSGKSAFDGKKAALFSRLDGGQSTLYVATGLAIDDEMKERIRRHQESRPPHWSLLEEPCKLAEKLAPLLNGPAGPGVVIPEVVIIDSVDVWVANLLMEHQAETKALTEKTVMAELDRLLALVRHRLQGKPARMAVIHTGAPEAVLHLAERVAEELIASVQGHLPLGIVLADGNYDSGRLYDGVDACGGQLLTPLPKNAGYGHGPQSPSRWEAVRAWEGVAGYVYRDRIAVERYFAHQSAFGGGLAPLPPWVRTLPRVRRWIGAKLII